MKNNKKYNPEIVETEGKLIPYRIYMAVHFPHFVYYLHFL